LRHVSSHLRLIEIDEAAQVMTCGAEVAHVHDRVLGNLVLNVKAPLLCIRSVERQPHNAEVPG
jgi:hypothetical protein